MKICFKVILQSQMEWKYVFEVILTVPAGMICFEVILPAGTTMCYKCDTPLQPATSWDNHLL